MAVAKLTNKSVLVFTTQSSTERGTIVLGMPHFPLGSLWFTVRDWCPFRALEAAKIVAVCAQFVAVFPEQKESEDVLCFD